jgi:sugar phosphate isomerase/epimerase
MTKNRLGLQLNTLKGGHDPRHLIQKIRAALKAGFNGVCLDVADVEGWTASGRHLRELCRLVKDNGGEVFGLGDVTVCDEWGRVADRASAFAAAAALGAPVVGAVYNNPEADLARARDDWAAFLDILSDVEDVAAALHFKGDAPKYNSLHEAWDIVSNGPPTGCLLLDLYDFWRGESTASSLEAVPMELIRMVHLADVGSIEREKATDADRTFPGEGVMPMTYIISTLSRRGYDGFFAVEVLGECRRQPCASTAAKAYGSARRLLGTSGPSHRKPFGPSDEKESP